MRDFHSCPPPALLLSSGGPSRSKRVWGERATSRDLLSPCPVQASIIAHFPARARGPGSPALHGCPSQASPESWSSRGSPAHRCRQRRSAPVVAQQEGKVEVKDHLRTGDFERASCYTQSRQDSEPGCQATNASQCPSTMRRLPGRRSRVRGKRHFLAAGRADGGGQPDHRRPEAQENQAHGSCASSHRGSNQLGYYTM